VVQPDSTGRATGCFEPKEFAFIHEIMLESHLQSEQADLAEIAAKVTDVLADLILVDPPDEQPLLTADVVANLGGIKNQEADPTVPAVHATEAIAQEFLVTMLKVCAPAARPDTIVASAAPEGHANSERSMQGSPRGRCRVLTT
jgi:hypothetical protein